MKRRDLSRKPEQPHMVSNDSGALVVQKVADIHLVEFLSGSLLDAGAIERVGRELLDLIENAGHPKFIISFSNISHISSAMLGVLIACQRKTAQLKGELRLAAIPPSIIEVFKLTKLDKLLKIYPTTDAALKKF